MNANLLKPILLACFILSFLFSNNAIAAVNPNPIEGKNVSNNTTISKKELRQSLKEARKTYKSLSKEEKAAYRNQLSENPTYNKEPFPWLAIGVVLLLVGGIMALLFSTPISIFAGIVALLGFVCLVVWLIGEITNR